MTNMWLAKGVYFKFGLIYYILTKNYFLKYYTPDTNLFLISSHPSLSGCKQTIHVEKLSHGTGPIQVLAQSFIIERGLSK